ncbi:DUF397 domain-containing protein [Streptomyces zhihengii]
MSGEESRSGTSGLTWFKSSYSAGDGGQCIEVATRPNTVHVRDSKDVTRTPLAVAPTAWTAFVHFAAL